jgi:hypothetical protein
MRAKVNMPCVLGVTVSGRNVALSGNQDIGMGCQNINQNC